MGSLPFLSPWSFLIGRISQWHVGRVLRHHGWGIEPMDPPIMVLFAKLVLDTPHNISQVLFDWVIGSGKLDSCPKSCLIRLIFVVLESFYIQAESLTLSCSPRVYRLDIWLFKTRSSLQTGALDSKSLCHFNFFYFLIWEKALQGNTHRNIPLGQGATLY